MKKIHLLIVNLILSVNLCWAQDYLSIIKSHISEKYASETHSIDWVITDQINGEHGITYIYLRQLYEGVEIYNTHLSVALKNNRIANFQGEVFTTLQKGNSSPALISVENAIRKASQQLEISLPADFQVTKTLLKPAKGAMVHHSFYATQGAFRELVPVKEMYYRKADNTVVPILQMVLYETSASHWWEIAVDAQSGEILQKSDWVTHCTFGEPHTHENIMENKKSVAPPLNFKPNFQGGRYNVFAPPFESPSHGNRIIISNPADSLASPFGWHDVDGLSGIEYTTTRGNNVYSYEDSDANNLPGYSPDGGSSLNFDYSFDRALQPQQYLDASITNTFFWSNIIHDVFYHNGFNEPAGNFQVNNYQRGGIGNDAVLAESQDGSGTNNANFATPPDGFNPRMQMFLWNGTTQTKDFTITAPASLVRAYVNSRANFGPALTSTPISGVLVIVNDGSADHTLGCAPIVNDLTGKIALIDRGTCSFVQKVKNAQNKGAIAVIIVNNAPGLIALGGTDPSITIPSIMISQQDGNLIKQAITNGNTVQGALKIDATTGASTRDSGLDNGVIVHEYGHGISNRLTGGPSRTNCLGNQEQMGEGWSDYLGLILTMQPNDVKTKARGIGTYVRFEPTDGPGIRPARYSPDFSVNDATYDDVKTLAVPHGVGFVWCTMLWDMTWEFIDRYGFDPDLIKGNGGNRKALQLVMEGMKLQPCSPGFIDGRNAILKADSLLNNGANQDIIWKAFARRGLGYSANQGSSSSRSDGTEAYDLPEVCFANAGKFRMPDTVSYKLPLTIQIGDTLPAFKAVFQTMLNQYELYFLLTRTDTILGYNNTGKFDFSALPVGKYIVWGMSAKNNSTDSKLIKGIDNISTYLSSKVKIIEIQQDADSLCIALNNKFIDSTITEVTIMAPPDPEPTSLKDNLQKRLTTINIFPNPSQGDITIHFPEALPTQTTICIYNTLGQKVWSGVAMAQQEKILLPLKKLGRGMYNIRLITTQGMATERKIIIQ